MKKNINGLGEFVLIDWIRKQCHSGPRVLLGIGDDPAILRVDPKKEILFTTDMLIEDRHFRRGEATAFQIGWKALAVNISDIAARGGWPTHAVLAMGLPKNLPVKFAQGLVRGTERLARIFQINLVGGDTNASDKIILSVSLLGECKKKSDIQRSGAKPGDVIFVTGRLGGSYLSRRHLTFMPRIKESQFLVNHFKIDLKTGHRSLGGCPVANVSRPGIT